MVVEVLVSDKGGKNVSWVDNELRKKPRKQNDIDGFKVFPTHESSVRNLINGKGHRINGLFVKPSWRL